MAVGVTLIELRRQLRAEVGQTLNVAQGANAQGIYDLMLARTQQELWEANEWPHLRYSSDIALSAGQRFYPYPTDMSYEAINQVWVKDTGNWKPVAFGIGVNDYASYGGEDARSWPVARWGNIVSIVAGKVVPAGQIEVLPVPAQAGTLRLEGQAPCNPLLADTDICVLDSTLIALYCAAEILANQKAENATLKLQKAQQYLRRLTANQGSDKRPIAVLGGAQIAQTYAGESSGRRFRIPGE
jgi:hypothetical protein